MISRRALLWTNRLLWTVLVSAVLALGALVSLGRYYLPLVESHQAQLVAELNQRSGLHIEIGKLRAYWQRLSPYVAVDDFRLYDPQHPDRVVLRIAHAEMQVGLFRSIHGGTLAISRLEGRGVQVALEEAELGHWRLSGFGGGGANMERVADLLLAIYRAELRDSRIDLQFFGGGEAHLLGERLQLQRSGDFRRLSLALNVDGQQSAPLTAVVEAHGDPRRAAHFSARGHAAFSGLDLTPLLPAAKAFGADLRYGRIGGEAWLDWRAGAEIELRGRVSMPQFDLAALTGRALAPLRDVAAEFLVRDSGGLRQLWLPRLTLQWGDQALDFSRLLMTADSRAPHLLQFAMPGIALPALRDALRSDAALPERARAALEQLAPAGELRNIRLTVPTAPGHGDLFRLRAELAGVSVGPYEGAPGAVGIDGYVDAGWQGGVVDLDAHPLALSFPHVYRDALRFDSVRGQVGWRLEADRVRVDSGPIRADSDAGRATALFSLDLPHDHAAAPLMTLMVGLRDSGAQYRDRFIPYTLAPSLLDWLGTSVQGGRVPVGGFVYRGSLVGAQHLERTVQLFLDVRDGRLRYQPQWPLLEDIRAAVWVDDDGLLVQSPSARTFKQVATRDVEVEMHHEDAGSWLTVRGDVVAQNDDALRILRESPLHAKVGAVIDRWGWRGRVGARLDLGFPLGEHATRPQELRVDAELQGGELLLADQSLRFTDVRGPLRYRSDSGLESPGIAGDWFGKPLAAKVIPEGHDGMRIAVDGHIGPADLREWLQQPLFDKASGETAFQLGLRIAGEQSELAIHSDLSGVAIDLPPPYAKPADQQLPFELRMSFVDDRTVSAALGNWADLQLQWREAALESGVLRLGKTGKPAPATGKFILTGALEQANFDDWRDLLVHIGDAAGAAQQKDAGGLAALALQLRDLQVGEARVIGQTLRHLNLSGQHEAKGWSLLARADNAAGSLVLPAAAGEPWQLRLDYLHLPPPAPGEGPSTALADVDPANAIAADVRIDRLWRGDEELGWVDLQMRQQPGGLLVQNLTGELRGIRIGPRDGAPASLGWVRQNGVDRTQFHGRLGVDDIGAVLQRFRFEKALTSKSGRLDTDFGWSGRPDQLQLKAVDGEAQLRFDEGRFLKASGSTAGALKVVGIFNFANFLRRLQLDFSDVFKDGVSFDSLDGGFALKQGVIETTTPVEIKSPSSRFRLAGNIDFNTDQTRMELIATLPVARNLPWVAALAGGLPAAAGVYVASKVFENQVDRMASVAYDISGPWTDPKVKLKRVFDDKLPQDDARAAAAKNKADANKTTNKRSRAAQRKSAPEPTATEQAPEATQ